MHKYKAFICLTIWILFVFTGSVFAKGDTLTQVSTINALLKGIYDGEVTCGELKKAGDFGLGTFNGLDGEMVAVDGRIYQVNSKGKAFLMADDIKTPFAAVTFFEPDKVFPLKSGMDLNTFESFVDSKIPTENIFYAIKIKGSFSKIITRSVPRQSKPYPLLLDVVKGQPEFTFKDVEGVIVGFRSPPYVKGVGVPGYHLHFLTEDRKAGGHILKLVVKDAVLEIDFTSDFFLKLPGDDAFYNTNLSEDQAKALKKVEKKK